MTTWNEADHPRDNEGKFTYKGGGTSTSSNDEKMQNRADTLYPTMNNKQSKENYNDVGLGKTYTNKELSREDILYPSMKSKKDEGELTNNIEKLDSSEKQNDTSNSWIMPVENVRISSPYGQRKSPGPGASIFHSGIDIAVPVGTPVRAISDGKVRIASGGISGYGNAVYINHGISNGKRIESEYGHVSKFCVKAGEMVRKGQIIAYSGGAKGAPGSGVSQGPHLHLTIREYSSNSNKKGQSLDPMQYIKM